MKNKKTTRRALFSSLLSLLLCCSMLLGTTFAWFTDSVTSSGNIIKSGTLDVKMYYGDEADDTKMTDVEAPGLTSNAIFDYKLWEPGFTQTKYIKVENMGDLAFRYQLRMIPNKADAEGSKLAEVIDVYCAIVDDGSDKDYSFTAPTRDTFGSMTKLGTLEELMANPNGLDDGVLLPETGATDKVDPTEENYKHFVTVCIALHMQESAGNEYQDLSVGDGFDVQLVAAQMTYEKDSFDELYDEKADYDGEISSEAALIAALQSGGVYKVVADIALTEAVTVAEGVVAVLNMNGKTISNPAGYVFESKGDLTIDGNGTFNGMGIIRSTAGKLTINNGNFYASSRWQDGAYQHTLKATNADVVINDGNFDATVGGHTNAVLNASTDATITINGGNFKNVGALGNFDPYLFTYEENGKVIIHDGTFLGGWRFNGAAAATDIYGGDFTVSYDGQSFNAASTHELTVYGGTFTPNTAYPNSSLTGKLDGVVASGYGATENGDGTWTVARLDLVYDAATMGDLYKYLPTLSSGDVLVLPAGTYTTSGTLTVPGGVTIKGADGAEVVFRQISNAQDNIFNCDGDVVIENISFESNRKGYAVNGSAKAHDTDGDITLINCKFTGIAAEKNWGVYKNLNGDLTIQNCTFDKYNNAICGVNNGGDSTTVITGCVFTNINGEAIGYVSGSVPADFESEVIANNTGLTEENVIGY